MARSLYKERPKALVGITQRKQKIVMEEGVLPLIQNLLAQLDTRGFKYPGLRQIDKICNSSIPNSKSFRIQVKFMYLMCKLARDTYREDDEYVQLFFRQCLSLSGQEEYKDLMEKCSYNLVSVSPQRKRLHLMEIERSPMYALLSQVPMRRWLPLSAAPTFWFEAEKKSGLTHVELDKPGYERQKSFAAKFRAFAIKYFPEEVICPPDYALRKVGNARYNDGGIVKKDIERCQYPVSGFLYQEFLTGPLTTREVWLPDRFTKDINSWWMLFVDLLSTRIPYNANGKTAREIWEECHLALRTDVIKSDITGFGFQYPREYLEIMAKVIADLYPHPKVVEQMKALQFVLRNVKVQYETGEFEFPIRGIGLGYFENLKALGVWALVDQFEPITAFGDQIITPLHKSGKLGSVPDDRFLGHHYSSKGKDSQTSKDLEGKGPWYQPTLSLINHGFLFTKSSKEEIFRSARAYPGAVPSVTIPWAGSILSREVEVEPRALWGPIIGAFKKEFHYERKMTLQSITLEPDEMFMWKYIAYHYERMFSYEFYPSESYSHPEDGGVNQSAQPDRGFIRGYRVNSLIPPNAAYTNSMTAYTQPYMQTRGSAKECKAFSKKRKQVFKRTPSKDVLLLEVNRPRIVARKTKKVQMEPIARYTPYYAEIRQFFLYGIASGKLTKGLSPDDILKAPFASKYARDIFESHATGGYDIVSFTAGIRGACEEDEHLARALLRANEHIKGSTVYRRDTIHPGVSWEYEAPVVERTKNPYLEQRTDELEQLRLIVSELMEDTALHKNDDFKPDLSDKEFEDDAGFYESYAAQFLGDLNEETPDLEERALGVEGDLSFYDDYLSQYLEEDDPKPWHQSALASVGGWLV